MVLRRRRKPEENAVQGEKGHFWMKTNEEVFSVSSFAAGFFTIYSLYAHNPNEE